MAKTAGREPKQTPAPSAPAATPQVGHNLTRDQKEAGFIRHMAAIREVEGYYADAQQGMKAVRKQRNEIRNACKRDGWSMKVVDEILEDEAKVSQNARMAFEEQRRFMREVVGLPTGVQVDLFAALEPEARTEAEWGALGYNAGLKGLPGKPQDYGVPPERHQIWLQRWGAGQERLSWALSDKGINPERTTTARGTGPTADEIKRQAEEDDDEARATAEAAEGRDPKKLN